MQNSKMAGNNPRKFSEKIALHLQKQAEEKAAFEEIMKEVSGVASKVCDGPTTQQSSQNAKTKQQGNLLTTPMGYPAYRGGSLPNVNQMTGHHGEKGQQGGPMFSQNQRSSSPRASSRNSIGPVKVVRHAVRHDHGPYQSPPSISMMSGAMQHGNSGSNLHSPGGGGGYTPNYLPLPMDAQWRRANSDSAINSLMIPSVVPDSSEESSNNSNDPRDMYGTLGQSPKHHPNDSSSVIPSTVGDGPSLLEIPSSVSTGSLPDLTTFQFTPPLQPPIDTEDSHSPYSTSPLSATYSPTGGSPHPPNASNSQQQQHQGSMGNQRIHGVPSSLQQQQSQQHPHQQQNQQGQLQNQQSQSFQQVSQHVQQQQLIDNPLNVNTSFQNFSNENMLHTSYRCPQRPSPLNSPQPPFRSPSPLDGQLSAPPSPAAQPSMNSQESYYNSQQANALQQHFEQISMMDGSRSPQRNTSSHWQGGGMVNNPNYYFTNTGQQQIQTGATAGVTQNSPQNHQPQTPQTPSSIPDIIFTDFSDVRSEPFEDILASEAAQALREGLGPIDIDELNMLADPGFVQLDPQAEDTFRLDKL